MSLFVHYDNIVWLEYKKQEYIKISDSNIYIQYYISMFTKLNNKQHLKLYAKLHIIKYNIYISSNPCEVAGEANDN